MIFLISPSKTMNLKVLEDNLPSEVSVSPKTVTQLRKKLQKLTTTELKSLYKVSDKIIESAKLLNNEKRTAKSIQIFEGLVFKNLDYASLQLAERKFLEEHVMIFSALYGIVSPAQLIMPYRLDLNNNLVGKIEDLTSIWQKKVTDYLIKQETPIIVNLASEEYTHLIDIKRLKKKKTFIQIDFLECREGRLTSIATYSKMARGQFVREVSKQNISDIEALKKVTVIDYKFSSQYSTDEKFIYIK